MSEITKVRQFFVSCPVDLMTKVEVLESFSQLIRGGEKGKVVQFVNANKVVIAEKDAVMRRYLEAAYFILADGMPLVRLSRWLGFRIPERIDGIGLMHDLIQMAAEQGHTVYFLGAKEEIVSRAVDNLKVEFPALKVAGYRNGYFKPDEIDEIICQINDSKADILFLGLPSPLKEQFAFEHNKKIQVSLIQGVGGSFDVFSGMVNRAPEWMQRFCLEWFYRVIQEPRKMFVRYLIGNTIFLYLVMRTIIIGGLKKKNIDLNTMYNQNENR